MSTHSKFKASLYDKRLFANIFSSIFLAKILTKMNECLFKNTCFFFSFFRLPILVLYCYILKLNWVSYVYQQYNFIPFYMKLGENGFKKHIVRVSGKNVFKNFIRRVICMIKPFDKSSIPSIDFTLLFMIITLIIFEY
jgi:hypothetical protein